MGGGGETWKWKINLLAREEERVEEYYELLDSIVLYDIIIEDKWS